TTVSFWRSFRLSEPAHGPVLIVSLAAVRLNAPKPAGPARRRFAGFRRAGAPDRTPQGTSNLKRPHCTFSLARRIDPSSSALASPVGRFIEVLCTQPNQAPSI